MNHKIIYSGVLALCLLVMGSTEANAFSKDAVTQYSVANSDAGTAVYELQVMLGGYGYDMYVPVVGEYGIANGTGGHTFGYQLERGHQGDESFVASSTALLIPAGRPLPVVDGMYKIPKYSTHLFRFIVFAAVAPEYGDTYRMRITELPFYFGDERLARYYTTGELKYMVTTAEPLHFTRDPE